MLDIYKTTEQRRTLHAARNLIDRLADACEELYWSGEDAMLYAERFVRSLEAEGGLSDVRALRDLARDLDAIDAMLYHQLIWNNNGKTNTTDSYSRFESGKDGHNGIRSKAARGTGACGQEEDGKRCA